MAFTLPQTPRALQFYSPICPNRFSTRKLLLEHLRSDPEESHKTLRFGACESTHYPALKLQGVLACPRRCGAFFNGGDNGVSKPLELHIRRRNCGRRVEGTSVISGVEGT